MVLDDADPVDIATLVIAVLAFLVSLFAVAYSKRSADAAKEAVELEKELLESRHIRWQLSGAKRGDAIQFELLNRGTSTAHTVRLALPPGYANLIIDGTSSRDLPSGKSLTFTIKRTVDSIPYPPENDALGSVPEWMSERIAADSRKLDVRELPTAVIVSCDEIADAQELPLPRPPDTAGKSTT